MTLPLNVRLQRSLSLCAVETGSRQQASSLEDELEHSIDQHLNATDKKGKDIAKDGQVVKKQNKNEEGMTKDALQTAVNTTSDLKYKGDGGDGQSKNQSNPATRSLGSSGQDQSADKDAVSDGVVDNEALTVTSENSGGSSSSGSSSVDENGESGGGGAVVSVSEEAQKASEKAEDEAIDNSDATPKEKELLHAARKLNKPRKVDPETGEQIERKILPLKPED